jgi:hypothetical protein
VVAVGQPLAQEGETVVQAAGEPVATGPRVTTQLDLAVVVVVVATMTASGHSQAELEALVYLSSAIPCQVLLAHHLALKQLQMQRE